MKGVDDCLSIVSSMLEGFILDMANVGAFHLFFVTAQVVMQIQVNFEL